MISSTNVEDYQGSKSSNDAWIAEAIWGHRLERQPPSALLLEFLGIAEGMYREGTLLTETRPGANPEYAANRSLQLRNLLFNNPRMEEILRSTQGSDEEGWNEWLPLMKEGASVGDHLSADFSYLRDRFDTFAELVSVIRLLRRITVDPGSERSWTTQFLFPIGPAALYEVVLAKGDGFELVRRVFTRTGEMAYLMLSRASASLRHRIKDRLQPSFDPNTSRNRLVMRLISEPKPDPGPRKGGTYLPYKTHPAFDRMAEDVAAVLELKLPDQDAFQFLGPLIGFHLYLYGIETANHWIGKTGLPPIVCEILAPRIDLVRKAAGESYLTNDGLGTRAIKRFLDTKVFSDPDLEVILSNASIDDIAKRDYLADHLNRTVSLKKTFDVPGGIGLQRVASFTRNGWRDNFAALPR